MSSSRGPGSISSPLRFLPAILSDGTSIGARPSDALTLATGVPIYVAAGVLEQSDRNRAARDLFTEADAAADDAGVVAEEVKARYAASAAELASRESPNA